MKILVAVIAYNEEMNIRATLQDLAQHSAGYDVVVIDNGSTDQTVNVCREMGVPYLSHPVNSGSPYGTVSAYFLYAFYRDYDVVCQFDGDGQHMASELPKILDPIRQGRADFVIGSRFIEKKGFQSTALRKLGIQLFSKINSFIVGQKLTDVTSGFKAYNKKIIHFFAKTYRKEIFDINQILLLSHAEGARICEVPVIMRPRLAGESEYGLLNSLKFPIAGFVNILGCVLQLKRKN